MSIGKLHKNLHKTLCIMTTTNFPKTIDRLTFIVYNIDKIKEREIHTMLVNVHYGYHYDTDKECWVIRPKTLRSAIFAIYREYEEYSRKLKAKRNYKPETIKRYTDVLDKQEELMSIALYLIERDCPEVLNDVHVATRLKSFNETKALLDTTVFANR